VSTAHRSGGDPLVTVIVPTHDHAATVDLALDSVLSQTVTDIEVVVIGDGATEEVRDALDRYPADPRLRTVLRPKSASRAEEVRHEVLASTRSTFVAYHGDDDLMLPDHLEYLLELLEGADFANPFPMAIAPDGSAFWYGTDLAVPECREWHQHPQRNSVSLTGVVHRLSAYRRLPRGWEPAPPGRWSDHVMWQQWFATPRLTYRTGSRPTTLKLDSALRRGMTAEDRRAELLSWRDRAAQPGFGSELASLADDAVRRFGTTTLMELARFADEAARLGELAEAIPSLEADIAQLRAELSALAGERDTLRFERDALRVERDALRIERDALRIARDTMAATKTWRLHDRLTRSAPARVLLRSARRS
jgi:hypothetical protein